MQFSILSFFWPAAITFCWISCLLYWCWSTFKYLLMMEGHSGGTYKILILKSYQLYQASLIVYSRASIFIWKNWPCICYLEIKWPGIKCVIAHTKTKIILLWCYVARDQSNTIRALLGFFNHLWTNAWWSCSCCSLQILSNMSDSHTYTCIPVWCAAMRASINTPYK